MYKKALDRGDLALSPCSTLAPGRTAAAHQKKKDWPSQNIAALETQLHTHADQTRCSPGNFAVSNPFDVLK